MGVVEIEYEQVRREPQTYRGKDGVWDEVEKNAPAIKVVEVAVPNIDSVIRLDSPVPPAKSDDENILVKILNKIENMETAISDLQKEVKPKSPVAKKSKKIHNLNLL